MEPILVFLFVGRGHLLRIMANRWKLKNRVPDLHPVTRAAAVRMHMASVAREVHMSVGNDQLLRPDGAAKILEVSHAYCAPKAAD